MAGAAGRRRQSPATAAVEGAVALAMVLVVYLDWWGRSVPALPGTATSVLSVSGGVLGGFVLFFAGRRRDEWNVDGRIAAAGFGVLVLIAVLVGTYLSPNGLPVGVEIGLLVALWTNVACQVVALAFDS